VHDPEKHDLSDKGQLTQTQFFAIFFTFVMYETHIRLTFVQTVKKLKIDPSYCTATVRYISCTVQEMYSTGAVQYSTVQ
jgi:hypothetical protein